MRQVLFSIPLEDWFGVGMNVPIYGFGAMLFLAFVVCMWLAVRLGRREGIAAERIQDLAVWIFLFGLVGARVVFMIQYGIPLEKFFAIWDGGLVFYGSFIGGTVGFFVAYYVFLRKYRISRWKLADILAPCGALGLCLGRIGCLLNGCCYGNVACVHCPEIQFPLSSPPRMEFVHRGLQTAAGFTMNDVHPLEVGKVEPDSNAYDAGLRDGDTIVKVNGKEVHDGNGLFLAFTQNWPRGKNDLRLTVQHVNGAVEQLPAFTHDTLGLHPTQLYETISMGLLVFLLLSYYPLKRRDGSIFVLFMVAYAVHRFLNEMLRTDTDKVAFGMTLSQNLSIVVLLIAAVVFVMMRLQPPSAMTPSAGPDQPTGTVPPGEPTSPADTTVPQAANRPPQPASA